MKSDRTNSYRHFTFQKLQISNEWVNGGSSFFYILGELKSIGPQQQQMIHFDFSTWKNSSLFKLWYPPFLSLPKKYDTSPKNPLFCFSSVCLFLSQLLVNLIRLLCFFFAIPALRLRLSAIFVFPPPPIFRFSPQCE